MHGGSRVGWGKTSAERYVYALLHKKRERKGWMARKIHPTPLLRIHPLRPSTLFYDAYLWAPVLFGVEKLGKKGEGGIFWSLVVADMHILGKRRKGGFSLTKWREKSLLFFFHHTNGKTSVPSFFAAKSFQKWDTRERKKIRQKGGLCAFLPAGISQGGLLAL